jgi:hypothetical protein
MDPAESRLGGHQPVHVLRQLIRGGHGRPELYSRPPAEARRSASPRAGTPTARPSTRAPTGPSSPAACPPCP